MDEFFDACEIGARAVVRGACQKDGAGFGVLVERVCDDFDGHRVVDVQLVVDHGGM